MQTGTYIQVHEPRADAHPPLDVFIPDWVLSSAFIPISSPSHRVNFHHLLLLKHLILSKVPHPILGPHLFHTQNTEMILRTSPHHREAKRPSPAALGQRPGPSPASAHLQATPPPPVPLPLTPVPFRGLHIIASSMASVPFSSGYSLLFRIFPHWSKRSLNDSLKKIISCHVSSQVLTHFFAPLHGKILYKSPFSAFSPDSLL